MSLLYRRALSRASESKQRLHSPSQLSISLMGNTNAGQVLRTMARKLVCLPEPSPPAHEGSFGEGTFGPSEKSSYEDFGRSEQSFPSSDSYNSSTSNPSPVEAPDVLGRWSIRPIMTKEQLEMALSRESLTLEKEDKRSSLKAMSIDVVSCAFICSRSKSLIKTTTTAEQTQEAFLSRGSFGVPHWRGGC